MRDFSAQIDQLTAQILSVASVLVESLNDPQAIEAAPIHHRAAAVAVVDRFLDRLAKRKLAADREFTDIEFVFGDEDEAEADQQHEQSLSADTHYHRGPTDPAVSPAAGDPALESAAIREYYARRLVTIRDHIRPYDPGADGGAVSPAHFSHEPNHDADELTGW